MATEQEKLTGPIGVQISVKKERVDDAQYLVIEEDPMVWFSPDGTEITDLVEIAALEDDYRCRKEQE